MTDGGAKDTGPQGSSDTPQRAIRRIEQKSGLVLRAEVERSVVPEVVRRFAVQARDEMPEIKLADLSPEQQQEVDIVEHNLITLTEVMADFSEHPQSFRMVRCGTPEDPEASENKYWILLGKAGQTLELNKYGPENGVRQLMLEAVMPGGAGESEDDVIRSISLRGQSSAQTSERRGRDFSSALRFRTRLVYRDESAGRVRYREQPGVEIMLSPQADISFNVIERLGTRNRRTEIAEESSPIPMTDEHFVQMFRYVRSLVVGQQRSSRRLPDTQ